MEPDALTEYDPKEALQEDLPLDIQHAESQEITEFVQTETFLENSGFFTPSSKRIKNIYTKRKKVKEITLPDGRKKSITVEINASHKYGLPITSDLDYYRAFLKICDEIVDQNGRFRMPIAIPTSKIIRYAGKEDSTRERRDVREWIRRMTLTGIEGGIYNAKLEVYNESLIASVFSQAFLRGEQMRNGRTADTNYVWLAPWFLSNFYYRNTRPFDYSYFQRLRKPIAKALYSLLGNGWYASDGKPYSKSYSALCEEFLLNPYRHESRIRQQLDPSHEELKRDKYLDRVEYRTGEKKGDFVIVWYAGERFFEERKEQIKRKQLAEQVKQTTTEPNSQLELMDANEVLLDDIRVVVGDDDFKQWIGAYRKATEQYPEALVRMTISETKLAGLEGRIKKTRGAYFFDTLTRLNEFRKQRPS